MYTSQEQAQQVVTLPRAAKPSLDEVLAYTEMQIGYYLRKKARAPLEQQAEAAQEARMRVFEHYEDIEGERGWRTYVQKQVFGAVWDYFDRGKGFEERRKVDKESKFKMPSRIMPIDGQTTLESIIDSSIFSSAEIDNIPTINWDLLPRLCALDHELHIFVRNVVLGYSLTESAPIFGVTRERLGQIVEDFGRKIADPARRHQWDIQQYLFALGLSDHFDLPAVDNGYGWGAMPVDFGSTERIRLGESASQISFGGLI